VAFKRLNLAWALGLMVSACDGGNASPLARPTSKPPEGFPSTVDEGFGVFTPLPPGLGAVVAPERRPPPISGGTLAVTADGALAVAADPDRDRVHLVTLADKSVTSLAFPTGSEPGRVVIDPNGRAHVVLRSSGELATIDLATKAVLHRSSVCALPRGVAFDAKDSAVLVACADGDLVTLDAENHSERRRVFVDRDLRDVVVRNDGQVLVSRYRSAELLKLDESGAITSRIKPLSSKQERFDDGLLAFGQTGQPEEVRPRQVTMSPTLAWRTLMSADGRVVTLHQHSQDDEIVADTGGYGGGGPCQAITQPTMTVLDGDRPSVPAPPLGDATLGVDFALSPDGLVLAIAAAGNYLQGSGTLAIYDTGLILSGSVELVLPCGFPVTRDGATWQATSVTFGADGKLYVQSREPALLIVFEVNYGRDGDSIWINGLVQVELIKLDESSVADTGHDLFHANVGSGIACASCHGEALDDGHVWNFKGFGPRRTQNMRGGLLGTEPFHWEGDMPTFQHLVDEVMTKRMGGFVVEPQYADVLATWIDAQPALKLRPKDSDAIARGKQLFEDSRVGCATCHNGKAFTNNQSFDVGTGGLFQVPSLTGVALRTPLMHDGCAETLADRFVPACGGGDKHGKTSHLSKSQIADLIAYLESL
jgi:mono/diheme cytochrome c family protein